MLRERIAAVGARPCVAERERALRRVRRQPGDRPACARDLAGRAVWSTLVRASDGSSPAAPVQQRLTQLDTIERQLEERGIHPQRQIIEFAFVAAPPHVSRNCAAIRCCGSRGSTCADGEPFAVVTVWCPAELGQHVSRRRRRTQAVLRAVRHRTPRRDPDHRCSIGQRGERGPVGSAARQSGAALRAPDDQYCRRTDPVQRTHLPRTPHGVRRRPAIGGTVDDTQRASPGRVICNTRSMSDRVTLSISDGIADVRMNRPDKRNALDGPMFQGLAEMGERLKSRTGRARRRVER